jgi:hypothetical protein
MATSQTPFEPTSSWSYQFARYEALPEILLMPEVCCFISAQRHAACQGCS